MFWKIIKWTLFDTTIKAFCDRNDVADCDGLQIYRAHHLLCSVCARTCARFKKKCVSDIRFLCVHLLLLLFDPLLLFFFYSIITAYIFTAATTTTTTTLVLTRRKYKRRTAIASWFKSESCRKWWIRKARAADKKNMCTNIHIYIYTFIAHARAQTHTHNHERGAIIGARDTVYFYASVRIEIRLYNMCVCVCIITRCGI